MMSFFKGEWGKPKDDRHYMKWWWNHWIRVEGWGQAYLYEKGDVICEQALNGPCVRLPLRMQQVCQWRKGSLKVQKDASSSVHSFNINCDKIYCWQLWKTAELWLELLIDIWCQFLVKIGIAFLIWGGKITCMARKKFYSIEESVMLWTLMAGYGDSYFRKECNILQYNQSE